LIDNSRTKVEIHPKRGLKMDVVTDKWIRICVGIAMVIVALLALAVTPALYALGTWW
jgi:hypothetical protein